MDEMLKARRVVPRLAVGALALALAIGVVLLWPWVEETRAIARLSSAGLSWNAEESRLRGTTDLGTLDGLGASLRVLQPKTIDLERCRWLQNVDGLKGLTTLATLDLRDCHALQNVDGLKGLTALRTLNLAGCDALQNILSSWTSMPLWKPLKQSSERLEPSPLTTRTVRRWMPRPPRSW